MAVNAAALALIKSAEGFVDHWYPDPAHGWKVPTVGYGHTDAAGAPFYADTKGKRFTEAEASAILLSDLARYEQDVRELVKVPLNENQHGALTSFDFNLGRGNLAKSTLLKKLNAGKYDEAAKEFGKWVNAAGKPLPGLVKRREAERLLFLKPTAAKPVAVEPKPLPIDLPDEHETPATEPRRSGNGGWIIAGLLVLAAIGAIAIFTPIF